MGDRQGGFVIQLRLALRKEEKSGARKRKRSVRERQMNQLVLRLETDASKVGMLVRGDRESKVSVLHKNAKGDTLVHDGKRIFMLPAHSVRIDQGPAVSEDVVGKERLKLVQSLYAKLVSGELDYSFIRAEI